MTESVTPVTIKRKSILRRKSCLKLTRRRNECVTGAVPIEYHKPVAFASSALTDGRQAPQI